MVFVCNKINIWLNTLFQHSPLHDYYVYEEDTLYSKKSEVREVYCSDERVWLNKTSLIQNKNTEVVQLVGFNVTFEANVSALDGVGKIMGTWCRKNRLSSFPSRPLNNVLWPKNSELSLFWPSQLRTST